jgi:hypothetical protein
MYMIWNGEHLSMRISKGVWQAKDPCLVFFLTLEQPWRDRVWRQVSKLKIFWWKQICEKKKKIDHDSSTQNWRNPNYLMIKCLRHGE